MGIGCVYVCACERIHNIIHVHVHMNVYISTVHTMYMFMYMHVKYINIAWYMKTADMNALKCKTLGASVMYIHCIGLQHIIHGNMHTRTNRECTGKYTEIWQRQKL